MLSLIMIACLFVSCEEPNDDKQSPPADDGGIGLTTAATTLVPQEPIPFEVTDEVTNFVMIDVEGYGKIVVELYPETAPITVENFKNLVSKNFYDGLIFHRVIYGFMIQGGGFDNTFSQKYAESIKGEFSSNGVQNDLLHTRGVISMARATDPDSASSQFFIMHQDAPHLDGDYAAFGMTVYGIEIVDAIASVQTGYADMPVVDVCISSMRFAKAKG